MQRLSTSARGLFIRTQGSVTRNHLNVRNIQPRRNGGGTSHGHDTHGHDHGHEHKHLDLSTAYYIEGNEIKGTPPVRSQDSYPVLPILPVCILFGLYLYFFGSQPPEGIERRDWTPKSLGKKE
ncbi:hypothetical protein PROFUN_13471 [Planoprotostelium fungivorum]|uniref:Uncharacterized protein n=1 Tax=Planoprotostelium fungivorum TaxID=1890364 RepID=A0A2P6N3U2_9EUKA|nr:hypothetical protein PROFUN_13471 [Planoprotostelium fungivorum]